jgi:hypothetical protein
MSSRETSSDPAATSSWISDFIRVTLLNDTSGGDISHWAMSLVELLRQHKPDHELHIFGVNRIPRLPNFFLGSSSEKFVREKPLVINVTQKTADLFLAPVSPGIRVLQEEMPMTVIYTVSEPPKRVELPFYDAICFDTAEHSIILGLIVTDVTVEEFMTQDELAELQPLVRSHAVRLLESLTLRHAVKRHEEEIDSLMAMMRQSNPELAALNFKSPEQGFVEELSAEKKYEAGFLQHLAAEMRSPLMKIMATNERLIELSNTSLGSPELHELAQTVHFQVKLQDELLRCLANIAVLSAPDVKPRQGVFPMQGLIREIYPAAVQIASRYEVEIKLEEYTRNIFLQGDQKTLVPLIERLLAYTLSCCPGGKLWIRTYDSTQKVEQGFVCLEFEDSGDLPPDLNHATLLEADSLSKLAHPRQRRGGGLLMKLLDLYMEKSGGKLRLCRGEQKGFCVQLMLPQVSRSEMERIKAGEISP